MAKISAEVLRNAINELEDLRWELIRTRFNGERLYGMDEWSDPVIRIKLTKEALEAEFKKVQDGTQAEEHF